MANQTPGDVFKEYVKSLIIEIANETPGASLVPDNEEVERQLRNLTVRLDDFETSVEDIDFDAVEQTSERLDELESAMGDINSATRAF